jgi:cbb3-type cytochrome oxidase subunit 3
MFTTGRIIFICVFVLVFVATLFWSYRKEKKLNKLHFKNAYMILIALILFLILQFLIVKIGKFL